MKNVSTFHVRAPFKRNGVRDVLSVLFLASFFLFAPVSRAQNSPAIWQKHLEHLKNDANKDYMGDLRQLKLLKYTYKGEIRSEKDKSRVIEAIYSGTYCFGVVKLGHKRHNVYGYRHHDSSEKIS